MSDGSCAATYQGGNADDFICGDVGCDDLCGGAGNDVLIGALALGAADNTGNHFIGGTGNDLLIGGPYADIYHWALGDGFDVIREPATLPGERDILQIDSPLTIADLVFTRDRGDLVIECRGQPILEIEAWFGSSTNAYQIDGIRCGNGPSLPGECLMFEGIIWNGTAGADTLTAIGGENFQLIGEAGNDTLIGEAGQDVLIGGPGNDTLNGYAADDGLYGDAGGDLLFGGIGDDDLRGGPDNDTMYGEAGADLLDGEAGNDFCYGGAGADTYRWNSGGGNDQVIDTLSDATPALNRLEFGPGILPANIEIVVAGAGLKFAVRNDQGVEVGSATVNDWYTAVSPGVQYRQAWALGFCNGVTWSGNTLETPGVDFLFGTSGNDVLSGGAGNDTLSGNAGNDTMDGGSGNDSILGDDGEDRLAGGDGNDSIRGGNGNDSFDGGPGNDFCYGESGSDTYTWNLGGGNDQFVDLTSEFSALTLNQLSFGAGISPSQVTMSVVGTALKLSIADPNTVGSGSVTINAWYQLVTSGIQHRQVWRIVFADGTIWNGKMLATPGDDLLNGDTSANLIFGGSGNDTLYGYDGNDTLLGDDGNDLIYAGIGDDDVSGNAGNDTLYGEEGIDTLDGGPGVDSLFGGTGNDTLRGGSEDDNLYGEAGNDIYRWFLGDGNDQLSDLTSELLANTENRLEFGAGILPSQIQLTLAGTNGLKFSVLDGAGNVSGSALIQSFYTAVAGSNLHRQAWKIAFADGTVWNGATMATPAADVLNGGSGNDVLSGGPGNDTINGNAGNDTLSGDANDDSLYGNAGDDVLSGGAGNDSLNGGSGADSLAGGAGNDSLDGDLGADVYRWSPGDGDDVMVERYLDTSDNILSIENFYDPSLLEFARTGTYGFKVIVPSSTTGQAGSILIDNAATTSGGNLFLNRWQLAIAGWNTYRFFNLPTTSNDTATGTSANEALVGMAGNDTLRAADGADFLTGGDGDDLLDGGAGDDLLVGGPGRDQLEGGTGNDNYFANPGNGADTIVEPNTQAEGERNRILFGPGATPESIVITRSNADLTLSYGSGDSLTIRNWFADTARSSAIESIQFAGGFEWGRTFTESRVGAGSATAGTPVVLGELSPVAISNSIDSNVEPVPANLVVLTPLHP